VVMICIAGISLLVGGIGIMNIMLATVLERTREIGIRRAIGARQADIVRQFLTEAVLISIAGGLIGIAFGVTLSAHSSVGGAFGFGALARTATDNVKLDAPMSAEILAAGFLLALIGGLLAGAAGAFRAARLRPADALRAVE